GYGTVKKRDLTGAVASMKAADIVKSPASNAMEALQGQVPGLDIVRNSGKATSGVTINIRGQRSLSDVKDEFGNNVANAPLFIIDGMQGGDFSDIAPADIESIEVLKDASSTAIYGSQGANGVIIITTKKGAQGKTKFSYNGYFGVNGWAQYPDMLSGEDYMQVRREAARTGGQWSSTADDQKLFTVEEWQAIQNGDWTNWVDEVLHTGLVQSHQVTASGGTEKTTAMLSAGYYQEKGSFKNDKMDKYNLRMNIEHKLGKTVKVGATTQITHYAQDERAENVLWRAATNAPLGKAYDEDGKVVEYPLGKNGQVSPLVDEASEIVARHHVLKTNLIANGYLDFTPIEGLTLRSNLGTNYAFYRKQDFEGASSIDRLGQNSSSQSRIKSSEKSFVNWDNIISYNKTIKDHTLGATALTSWTQSKYTSVNAQGEGQLVDSYLWHNLGANDKSSYVIGSDYIQHQTFSYALRFNYSYKGRYMLTVSNRWDGDSRLSKGNKWASFPSVAAAWRISDEAFMKNVEALSNLKLRLSWGKTGNSGIMAYGTQSGLTPKTNSAFQDNGYTYYIYNEYVGNENVGWEMSNTWDLGFDIGLFNNRISAVVDLYQTKTTDILLPRTLPTSMGGSNATPFKMYQNIGATMNRGIEVSVNTVNVDNKNFKWNSTLTFAANHEEITDLIDGKDIIGSDSHITTSLLMERPLKSFYHFINEGIWQENEAEEAAKYFKDSKKTQPFKPGDIKLRDLNGDYIIDDKDETYLGSQSPKWTGGFNNNFSYKNFDLNVYIIARWGQMIDYELTGSYDPQGKGNFPAYLNYWTPENPSNDFPRPAQTNFYNYLGYQTLNYIDGSYWKIKTVSLGYTFPKSLTSKLGVSKLRAYVTANNLFSFAKNHLIQDYDAERGGSAKAPLQRQFIFGLNLDF
ncbi:SusC/RagA family TonB-linked outer membrane protein, partial [Phocaeicola sartorii]|uniref:SusC/RagA family TonB-linked outer membrane protein n=1 Tax=Phocaeicola sartorii TaxID=671267 RepID=UPI0027297244